MIRDEGHPGTLPGKPGLYEIKSTYLALLFPLTLFGYSTIAPLLNYFAPAGNATSIAFRALVLLSCLAAVLYYRLKPSRQSALLLFPMFLFLGLYAWRLVDNYYVQQLTMYASPELVFGLLIGATILPAWVLGRAVVRMNERCFIRANLAMMIIFLVGVAVNYDLMLGMVAGRSNETMLFKLNAISLSSIAASYALLLIIMSKVTRPVNLIRIGVIMLLLGIVAITRSRGPLLGTVGALIIYFYFVAPQYKKYLIRILVGVGILVPAAATYFELNFINIAFERFFDDGSKYSIGYDTWDGTGRLGQWAQSWEDFLENPILGEVVYEQRLFFYPHNLIMESLISLGLIGTAILFLHLWISIRSSVSLLRDRRSTLIDRFSALIYFKALIQAQFSFAIWSNTTFWLASACVIALAVFRQLKKYKIHIPNSNPSVI